MKGVNCPNYMTFDPKHFVSTIKQFFLWKKVGSLRFIEGNMEQLVCKNF